MAGITVSSEDLTEGLGVPALSPARFEALRARVLRIIRTGYSKDPDLAEGRAADVLNAVFESVATRVLTNPGGARSLGLGSANVTFGGTDEDLGVSLTPQERADLRSIAGGRRPSYVTLRSLRDPVTLEAL